MDIELKNCVQRKCNRSQLYHYLHLLHFADITDLLCQHISNGSVAIIYFTNTEKFGRSTAASQYFLQMAGFLGIPVIAWNADNAGLESVH